MTDALDFARALAQLEEATRDHSPQARSALLAWVGGVAQGVADGDTGMRAAARTLARKLEEEVPHIPPGALFARPGQQQQQQQQCPQRPL